MSLIPPALDSISKQLNTTQESDTEGWLVSYADLITLLFIFFSVMLSISVVSKAKFDLLTKQFNQNSTASLVELKKHLDKEIQNQKMESQITTQIGDEGLQIQFNEKVLFGSGEAVINEAGVLMLQAFAKLLTATQSQFHLAVEGHTDDRPIHTAQFKSNWSLSASRSVNVLHLMSSSGMDEKRMMVRAYADTRPAANDRNQNRRVTLLVY